MIKEPGFNDLQDRGVNVMAVLPGNSIVDGQRKELVEHGSVRFPVACYYSFLAEKEVPWHWHEALEVLIVERGAAEIVLNTGSLTAKAGEGVFINAEELHFIRDWDASDGILHTIVFHPRLVGGGMESVFWQKYLDPLVHNPLLPYVYLDRSKGWHGSALDAIAAAWESCRLEETGYEFDVRASLSRLVFALAEDARCLPAPPSEKNIRDDARVKTMLRYIHKHYQEEIAIAQIAGSAMISKSECLRCFGNTIGVSPMQYVKQFRLQKAAELLESGSQKIGDIGAECGFMDMSYFAKAFREWKGCTPGSYRKKWGETHSGFPPGAP